MHKIIFTGPESTGKTTLTSAVAAHFQTIWVEEYARVYLEELGRPYTEKDLVVIAKEQHRKEQAAASFNSPFLFCDTSLLVLKIWSEYKYQRCHPWIINQLKQHPPTLYFLCGIDVPWQADPLREHPQEDQRRKLFNLYERAIINSKTPYIRLSGNQQERLDTVLDILKVYT